MSQLKFACGLFITSIALITSVSVCQAEVTDETSMFVYSKEKPLYVYDSSASLRNGPSQTAEVIEPLPVDTALTLVEETGDYQSENTFTQNGLELPWLKVTTPDQKTGYVWAGYLAKTSITVDMDLDDVPERILTSILSSQQYNDYKKTITTGIKVLRDGKVIDTTTFESPYFEANGLESSLYTPAGFSPYIPILREHFKPEACSVLGGYVFFAWHNGHWVKGFTEEESSDAGMYSSSVEFVFPLDRGGKTNQIKVIRNMASDFNEATGEYKNKSAEFITYTWDNGRFIAKKGHK